MKLLAQSLIPVNPAPYLHLGYTSAYANTKAVTPIYEMLGLGGFILLVIGLILLSNLGKQTRVRKYIGLVLIVLGVGFWVFMRSEQFNDFERARDAAAPYRYPYAATYDHAGWIEQYLVGADTIPSNWPAYVSEKADDGWKHRMRVESIPGKHPQVRVISAGPDGRFATADDIVFTENDLQRLRELQRIGR